MAEGGKGGDEIMDLDFLIKLNQYINAQRLIGTVDSKPLTSQIGLLAADESMSIMAMPGGAQVVFFDGTRDKAYQVQINVKSKRQDVCMNALNVLSKSLENLDDLPSSNNSYEFKEIKITSFPSFLHQDEQGFFVWVLSISAEITIFKGVVE